MAKYSALIEIAPEDAYAVNLTRGLRYAPKAQRRRLATQLQAHLEKGLLKLPANTRRKLIKDLQEAAAG